MTQYDTTALVYQKISASVPLRDAEWHSPRVRPGDLAGRSVLDLACGDEDRHAPHQATGAAHVVGIDILAQMIALALQRKMRSPRHRDPRTRKPGGLHRVDVRRPRTCAAHPQANPGRRGTMQGFLRGTVLCFALALSLPAGAQGADAPPPDTTQPDTAQLRQGLAAALGSDFQIVRTELHSGLRERGGIFWLAHVRPLRSGDYFLRYVHEYIDRVRPEDPLYTHVEHTTGFSVGEAGCARRAEGRTACLGDVIVIPVMAGDGRGPLGGHVFEASRRGDAGAWQRFAEPAPDDARAATTPNPAAPHLRYLGAHLGAMPHRSLGETMELSAVFEAGAPGALELSVGAASVSVVVVARGTPVTVLLEHERIRQYHQQAGFASHTGSQYSTDVLLLQPGDRMDMEFLARTVRGRDFSAEEKEAFRRTPPHISARPFRVDRERRFNAFIAEHLPAGR